MSGFAEERVRERGIGAAPVAPVMAMLRKLTVADQVERILLRWIRYEFDVHGGRFPTHRRLARHLGVGPGLVREVLKRLEARGLATFEHVGRVEVVPAPLAVSVDCIAAFYLAARSEVERLQLVREWIELKWLAARAALPEAAQLGASGSSERLAAAVRALALSAMPGADGLALVHEQLFIIWTAADIARVPGSRALTNSLVRSADALADAWMGFVDAAVMRTHAIELSHALQSRSEVAALVDRAATAERTRLDEIASFLDLTTGAAARGGSEVSIEDKWCGEGADIPEDLEPPESRSSLDETGT